MAVNFSLVPLLILLGLSTQTLTITATVFTLLNNCPYTIWPGILSGNSVNLGNGGFALAPNASVHLPAPKGWSGRFWARTHCVFSDTGAASCATGNCGAGLQCAGTGGEPPVTLAEFTLNDGGGMDFYDVSLVDGYNVGVGVTPTSGSRGHGGCRYAGCSADLNAGCPPELRVVGPELGGAVVACKSACTAFGTPEYCCTGDHGAPQTCSPSSYAQAFKKACPAAYSYAFDDASSTRTCMGSDYLITFCPNDSDTSSTHY